MTSKLKLYNKALRNIGDTRLANLNENRKPRLELDSVYDDALTEFLNKGLWHYAIRTRHATPDTGIEPGFGPEHAYPAPDDFVRLVAFCTDEELSNEDLTRRYERGIFYSHHSEIYISYISNDAEYGLNLGAMGELAAEYVGANLAMKTSLPIKGDHGDRVGLEAFATRTLFRALVREAMDERPKFKPVGRLVRARSRGIAGSAHIRNGKIGGF